MKRTIFALLALMLTLCLPVQALTFPGMGGSGPLVISGPPSDLIMDLIVLSEEDTLALSNLPLGEYYGFLDADGRGQLLPVEWALEDPSLAQPGLHQLAGRVVLPEGASLAEGYDGTVTLPVFRKGDGAVLELSSLTHPGVNDPLLPLEGDPASLKLRSAVNTPLFNSYVSLSTKDAAELSWEWGLSDIDPSTQGVYTVTAALRYPDWIAVPEELQTLTETVYVMDTTGIQIFAPTQHSTFPVLRLECYWIYDSSNVTQPVLEYRDEDGLWQACDSSWYVYKEVGPLKPANLTLFPESIPAGIDHILRLRYQDVVDGQPVARFSDPVTLNIPENIRELMEHSDTPMTLRPLNGDRDGSDSGGADLPDISQPVPHPPEEEPEEDRPTIIRPVGPKRDKDHRQEESPTVEEEPPVLEIVTDSYSAISGLRLQQLIALGDTVLFEKTCASVEVPSALLAALDLGDRELLEVTLLRPEEFAVELQMLANGQPVTDLTGSWGYLPWTVPQGAVLQCRDLSGALLPTPQVLPSGCTVRFAIDQPGTYILQATLPSQQPAQPEEPAAPAQSSSPVLSQQPLPAPAEEDPQVPAPQPEAPVVGTPQAPAIPEDAPLIPQPPVMSDPAPEKVPSVAPQEQLPTQPLEDAPAVPQTALTASAAHQRLLWPALAALAVLLALIIRRWRHG